MEDLENKENPMIMIKIQEKKGKNLLIAGLYRQWKAPGESGANTSEGIRRQCKILEMVIEKLTIANSRGFEIILAGDFNIKRHMPNDPCSRPELKTLTHILEDFLLSQNMAQINFKPTRHQVGCNSSLLDLL